MAKCILTLFTKIKFSQKISVFTECVNVHTQTVSSEPKCLLLYIFAYLSQMEVPTFTCWTSSFSILNLAGWYISFSFTF